MDAALSFFSKSSHGSWLAREDPLQPNPSEVTLITSGFDFPNMNAEMNMQNDILFLKLNPVLLYLFLNRNQYLVFSESFDSRMIL